MAKTKGKEKAAASNVSPKVEDAYGDDVNGKLTPEESVGEEAAATGIVSGDKTTEKGNAKEDVISDGVVETTTIVVCGGVVEMADKGDKEDTRNDGIVEVARNTIISEDENLEEEGKDEEGYDNVEKLNVVKQLGKAASNKAKQMLNKKLKKKAAAATPTVNSNTVVSNDADKAGTAAPGGAASSKDVEKLKVHDKNEEVIDDGELGQLSKLQAKRLVKKKKNKKEAAAAAVSIINASSDADQTREATVAVGDVSHYINAENVTNAVAAAGDVSHSQDVGKLVTAIAATEKGDAKQDVKSDGVIEATTAVVSGGEIADGEVTRNVRDDGNVEAKKISLNSAVEMADKGDEEDTKNDGNAAAAGNTIISESKTLEEDDKNEEGCDNIEKLKDDTELWKASSRKAKQMMKKKTNTKAAASVMKDVRDDGNVEAKKISFNSGVEMADKGDEEDTTNGGNTEAAGNTIISESKKLEEEDKKEEGCDNIEKLKDDTQLRKASSKKAKQMMKKKTNKKAAAAASAVNSNAVASNVAEKPGTAEVAADGAASSKDVDKLKLHDKKEEIQDDKESGKASNLKAKRLLKKKNKKEAAAASGDAKKTRTATATAGDAKKTRTATTDAGDVSCSRDADKILTAVAADADAAYLKDAKKPGTSFLKEKDLKKKDGMGLVFMCSKKTKNDCYKYKVLGLPESKKETVAKVYKGMKLFLFDIDLRLLYGIYEAAGPGGYNIEPKAFKSAFPSQVRFTLLHDCKPLAEENFKDAIKNNYYRKNKFNCVLSPEQVKNLCKLFTQSESRPSKLKRASGANRAGPVPSSTDRSRKRRRPAVGESDPIYRRRHDLYESLLPARPVPSFTDRGSKRRRHAVGASDTVHRRRHDLYEREASPSPSGPIPSSTDRGRKRRRPTVDRSDPAYRRRRDSYEREASPLPAGLVPRSTDRGRKRRRPEVGSNPIYRSRHDLYERESYPSPPPRPVAHLYGRDAYPLPPPRPVAHLHEREVYLSPPSQPVAPPWTVAHFYEREREAYPLPPPRPVALPPPLPLPTYASERLLDDHYYQREPPVELRDPIALREPVRYGDPHALYREPGLYREAPYHASLSSSYPPSLYRY